VVYDEKYKETQGVSLLGLFILSQFLLWNTKIPINYSSLNDTLKNFTCANLNPVSYICGEISKIIKNAEILCNTRRLKIQGISLISTNSNINFFTHYFKQVFSKKNNPKK